MLRATLRLIERGAQLLPSLECDQPSISRTSRKFSHLDSHQPCKAHVFANSLEISHSPFHSLLKVRSCVRDYFPIFHNLLHGDLLPARPLGRGCPSASHAPSRDPRMGVLLPGPRACAFFSLQRNVAMKQRSAYRESAPAALLPHLPPPPPLTLLWAGVKYCSSIRRVAPFSPSNSPPAPKISPQYLS